MTEILTRIEEQNKQEKNEVSNLYFGNRIVMCNVTVEVCKIMNIHHPFCLCPSQAGLAAAPARAVSAVKEMNIPQRIKDIKLPELPSIGNLKF